MESQVQPLGFVPPLDFGGPVALPKTQLGSDWLEKSVWEHFQVQVAAFPTKVAVSDGSTQFTYLELEEGARKLWQGLSGLDPTRPIALLLPNSVYFPMSMLACLAAGIPYLPLEIHTPIDRRKSIMEQAGVQLLMDEFYVQNHLKQAIPENPAFQAQPNSVAYILYTSGSTGQPKGVFQSQANLLHDVGQYIESVHLHSSDRLSLLYHPSVNGAIRDIYGSLLCGASLFIRDLKTLGLTGLDEFIIQNKLTIYHSLPTIFRGFLRLTKRRFPLVRLVYLAGDRIYGSDAELFKTHFSEEAFLYVGIGSTENATIYRQRFLLSKQLPAEPLLKMGYAVPDRIMELWNEAGHPVETGEAGEIVVRSAHLALGYWNNPELTQSSFEDLGKERRFKTGDLGRIDEQGQLLFLGRKDRQVKINGYRVEASEIESVLKTLAEVEELALVFRTQKETVWPIVYFQSRSKEGTEARLKELAQRQLPDYAQPKEYHALEQLPLLPNFKIDYTQLKELDEEKAGSEKEKLPIPLNSVSQKIRSVWVNYLPGSSFEHNLGFEEAGGDSMSFVHFLADLQALFDREIPLQRWGKNVKPQQLMDWLKAEEIPSSKAGKVFFFPDWNYKPDFLELAKQCDDLGEVVLVKYNPDYPVETGFTLLLQQYKWMEETGKIKGFVALCRGVQLAQRVIKHIEAQTGIKIPLVLLDAFPMYDPVKSIKKLPAAIQRGEWGWYNVKKLVETKLFKWFGTHVGKGGPPNPKFFKTYAVPTTEYNGRCLLFRSEKSLKGIKALGNGWERFLPDLQIVFLEGKDHYDFMEGNLERMHQEIRVFLNQEIGSTVIPILIYK
jgi:acyl-coenzyme A synthetase/AMP-(fatty) acid ligase/acyl carrier protein